jgi:hypothetical protein
LVAPGTITGRVTVEDLPAQEVFCYIPGSSLAVITDSGGHFTLPALPPGIYSLKLAGLDLESRILTGIQVGSDSVTVLAPVPMMYDSRLAPGVPRDLAATLMDTALNHSRLTWIPPATLDIAEYLLYSAYFHPGDTSAPVWRDTVAMSGRLSDGTPGVYDNEYGYALFLDSAFRDKDSVLVEYRVTAVDGRGNTSTRPSDPARLVFLRQPWMKSVLQLSERSGQPGGSGCVDTLDFHAPLTGSLADSVQYHWNLEFYRGSERIYEFNGKYYDENGIMHPAVDADSLSWWYGKHDLFSGAKPDSILAGARVAIGHRTQYDRRELRMPFKIDSAGCYRAAGPAYDPKIY